MDEELEVTQSDQAAAAALMDSFGGVRFFEKAGMSFAGADRLIGRAFAAHRLTTIAVVLAEYPEVKRLKLGPVQPPPHSLCVAPLSMRA